MEKSDGVQPEVTQIRKPVFIGQTGQGVDSGNSQEWRKYLEPKELLAAWSVPDGSPYASFQRTATIASVERWADQLSPRYTSAEAVSEQGIDNLISSGLLDQKDTAIILDSGGAHSVAMAARLSQNKGYQVVVMLNGSIEEKPLIPGADQDAATLLYFAQQMAQIQATGQIPPDAPPVFVLDKHRHELFSYTKTELAKRVDNRYVYSSADFPTADQFRAAGITKVLYLDESQYKGRIRKTNTIPKSVNRDIVPLIGQWESAGMQVLYTGVFPWPNIGL